MKTLHVIHSMNPAYGGLSACLGSLLPELARFGHPAEIVCLDDPAEPFLAKIAAPVHALGPAPAGYGFVPQLRPWLQTAALRFDAVIVHGLWQYHGWAVQQALAARGMPPYFVFPHGMLDPWFRRQYPLKHLKKLFYWWFAERRLLRRAAAVLFTCEEERRLAHTSFPGSSYRERVVPLGIAAPPDDSARQRAAFARALAALRGRTFWLFLGRIHPKKGVDLLIEAYARLSSRHLSLPRLVLAGPCADATYLRQLKDRATALCPAEAVLWPGMLTGDVKWGALRSAEAFVLPSHQENFGIAVAEALACGTPVLLSDQVNIWREITADGAGLVEPDTAAGTLHLLGRWQALDAGVRWQMRSAAAHCFQQRYEVSAAARSLLGVLQTGTAPRPPT